jgi:hypothetical protein
LVFTMALAQRTALQEHRDVRVAPRPPLPNHASAAVLALQRTAGNRAVAGLMRRRGVIARDAAAKQSVADAVGKSTPEGLKEAYWTLNGLAMFDLLSTLTALQRSGQFDALRGNLGVAENVSVPRLQIAFAAVAAKAAGAIDPEPFIRANARALEAQPIEQRRDIINYLDPKWFDSLKANEDAERLITEIRATAAYQALDGEAMARAEDIIAVAKTQPAKLVYYLTKLKQLFDTPVKSEAETAAETRAETTAASAAETKRVAQPAQARDVGKEERASRDPRRHWVARPGKYGGGTYYIDVRSPTDIVVKARIFLRAVGKGKPNDVADVKRMQDGIEKAASAPGYIVDIIFVDAPTPDENGNPPFVIDVDTGKWEVATNWAGGSPTGFAHELHHVIEFELDRYDYVEAHSTNESMDVPDRLVWFRKEMDKPAGFNNATSIMNNAAHPNDDDVCRVAQLELASCVAARRAAHAAAAP